MYHISSLAPRGIEIYPERPNRSPKPEGFSALLLRNACQPGGPADRATRSAGYDGTGSVAGMIREALTFLDRHPRIANLPFGKAISLLVRGSADLAIARGAGGRTEASTVTLLRAVETVQTFLAEHPSVADASIGRAAAGLAAHMAGAIEEVACHGPAISAPDRLVESVKMAEIYLKEHPQLATMPLGETAAKLIEGARSVAGGSPTDPDLQTLARRVGHFVQDYPRLAGCDFGQIVLHLVGSFLSADTGAANTPAAQAEATAKPKMSLAA